MRAPGRPPRPARRPRSRDAATSCSSGSGSPRRPTAGSAAYSGGMKRRLDLALALVHAPELLFLDEPTTGLDIQSRAALWDEVARLARDDGVTVFLTTQYLEEADSLADRVGIIDRGRIVAEGTPAALKAEIGRPTVEAIPADGDQVERLEAVLARFGEPALPGYPRRGRGAARRRDARSSPTSIRALDSEGIEVADLAAPRAEPRRRLPGQDRALARGRRRREAPRSRHRRARADAGGGVGERRCPSAVTQRTFPQQARYLAWRSVLRTARQPIMIVPPLVFPLFLLAINASRARRRDRDPGLPDELLPGLRPRLPVHAGRAVRHQHGGDQPRRGHRHRLLQPPLADPDARLVAARRPARRACCWSARSRRSPSSPSASRRAPTSRPDRRGSRSCSRSRC